MRKGKATVLMRTMVVQLLVEDNRAYGAVAFNFRTGEWHVDPRQGRRARGRAT